VEALKAIHRHNHADFWHAYYIHTQPFNGPLSGTTWVSWYQKVKTILDLNEARYYGVLGCSVLQAGCPSCRLTNSVKALKANSSQ